MKKSSVSHHGDYQKSISKIRLGSLTQIEVKKTMTYNFTKRITRIKYAAIRRLGLQSDWTGSRHFDPGRINVIGGPNGSGKTTILEIIECLSNAKMLATLRRSSMPNGPQSFFEITFDSGSTVGGEFKKRFDDIDQIRNRTHISLYVDVVDLNRRTHPTWTAFGYAEHGDLTGNLLSEAAAALGKIGVKPYNLTARAPSDESIGPSIATELNNLAEHLFGLVKRNDDLYCVDEIVGYQDGKYFFHFSDDPHFPSLASEAVLPSGWIKTAQIIARLKRLEKGSIVTIDELETNLHPTLQRVLAAQIVEITKSRDLQIFITTHSPTFLNAGTWDGETKFFTINGDSVDENPHNHWLLDSLGIRNSDLLQSNGIIWVEGPSDRIYIKEFINTITTLPHETRWKNLGTDKKFVENRDYSFAFFGGSSLSHYDGAGLWEDDGPSEMSELISMLKINRNSAIFLDRDADFVTDDFGNAVAVTSVGKTKSRVIDAMLSTSGDRSMAHVTYGYTIENYLPAEWRAKYLDENPQKTSVRSDAKTKLAIKFSRDRSAVVAALESAPLRDAILLLKSKIARWNRAFT